MKSIKVKAYNKLIEAIKLDGDTGSWNGKLKKRIVDAIRLAKECRAAAKIARENGDDENANWLEKRAEDYEQAARNWNQDTLDDDTDDQVDGSESDTGDKGDEAESANEAAARAQNAANRAKAAADSAKKAADEAQEEADDAAKNKTPEEAADATEKAKKAAEAAKKAEEAAEAAQQAADEAKEAAANGNTEKAQEAADKAESAEQQAQDAADQAMGNKSNGSQNGSDEDHDDSTEDDSDSHDSDGSKSSDDSKSDGGDSDVDSDESGSDDDSTDDSENEDSSDSDEGDKDESDSDEDSDSDSDSDSESSSKGSKGKKSKSSSSDSGSDGDSDDSESDDEDEDEDGDDSSDEPIKDPFADDEDIPSLNMGSPNGQEPRDATIDDIIKQLKGLEGEAKRGAIAGLKDLLDKKNESLTEAFQKSIRDYDDEEWDDLNNETIDRIEKVKKVDTIDDIEGVKAGFKGWSDNAVARQELEDEENQNIQRDILKKRAREQELDKYSSLETLKDFEIDFENCIRDQVDLVMQEYQSYDEINPEYEDENIIMKADVQRMIPDEVIPSVAVFFDQSSSWSDSDIKKGEQAIATVKQKYVDTGLCKLDLFYFSDIVVTNRNSSALRNGTTAWPDIIRTIASNDPKNVIIMTDSDMNTWNNHGESYTVEGCVWWIWKDGRRAPNLPKQLRGMQHNYECEFH